MKIKNILVSQPVPAIAQKSPYYEIQNNQKVNVDYHPFIKVEGVSLKEFRSQRTEILEHTAVIFTSRTTVDNFFRICEEARINIPETMKYICNTEAVALYLQKYIIYRKRKISFANGSLPNFIELILKYKDENLLLVLSEPYNPELPNALEKLKVRFNKVILSHTVGNDLSDINIKGYDLLLFFSPAEISSLVQTFGTEELPFIATFGEGTARAALEAGLDLKVTAPTPEAPSMSKAVDIFISKYNSGQEVPPVSVNTKKPVDEIIKQQSSKNGKRVRKLKTETAAPPKSKVKAASSATKGRIV